jgi:hypothetical protein
MNSPAPAQSCIERDIAQIVQSFESATIDPADFSHETHIMVGWWYLQEHDLLEAITRFTRAIRRLTSKLGVSSKYHETITWFYLIKIAERASATDIGDWAAFKAANPDLFSWNPGLLQNYYSDELLASGTAKRMFALPDLLR